MAISAGEKAFIVNGVKAGHRADGRGRLDMRLAVMETGLVPGCNGSARLKVEDTDILVGVKVDIGEVDPEFPDEGKVIFSVDCCPPSIPEGGNGEEMSLHLQRCLESVTLHSSAIDLKSLSIIAGSQCWIVYVDVLVLNSAGNLVDAASVATKAALHNTRIPKYTLSVETDEGEDAEIEISDDAEDGTPLDVEKMPIMVTLSVVDDHYIADAAADEEGCVDAQLTFAVNGEGHVFTVQKAGVGGVRPEKLTEMLQVSRRLGMQVSSDLAACLVALEESESREGVGVVESSFLSS